MLLIAVGHPLHEEARDQHQQQGSKLVPYLLDPLFWPAEVKDQDPPLERQVTGHHQCQQQKPYFPKSTPDRNGERVLPGPFEQAANHQYHCGQRQRCNQGAQQQAAGETEFILGHLADTRCYVVAELAQMAGQFDPAPGQHQ